MDKTKKEKSADMGMPRMGVRSGIVEVIAMRRPGVIAVLGALPGGEYNTVGADIRLLAVDCGVPQRKR